MWADRYRARTSRSATLVRLAFNALRLQARPSALAPHFLKVVRRGMLTTSNKPATPQRIRPMQALSSLFRTPTRLHTPTVSRCGKRARARASSLSSSVPSTPGTPSLPAVVLQTYSVSTDSIVLTSLPTVPFCCHEDLLTMSRAQLESAVRALNTRLPGRMQICPEDDFWQNSVQDSPAECDAEEDGVSRMSEAEMRRRIEELVGIRPIVGKNRVSRLGLGLDASSRVPPAPKAVRTRNATWRPFAKTPWEMEVDDAAEDYADELNSILDESLVGSSPLASRTKLSTHVRRRSSTLSLLPILQEENEGNESKEDNCEDNEGRPLKRQRVFSAGMTHHSQGFDRILHITTESRLVENMDVSGSPLLAEDDSSTLDSPEVARTTGSPPSGAEMSEPEGVHTPLQRRRSARIKAIALKRASSVNRGKKIHFNAMGLKSTILRSRTFSRRSPTNNLSPGEPDAKKGSGTPREIAIRLPFTSTPPHPKPESSVWSSSRALRSHSQRFLNANKSTETGALLGRSQSERYPRASDLAFVTIDRPRYRFSERKSSRTKVANRDQELHPLPSVSPARVGDQLQQNSRNGVEHSYEKSKDERENGDPNDVSKSFTTGAHRICAGVLSSALCNLLSPRSRALSTSSFASTHSCTGDSPAQASTQRTANTVSASNDGTTECIWEALERMAVDSRQIGLSDEC